MLQLVTGELMLWVPQWNSTSIQLIDAKTTEEESVRSVGHFSVKPRQTLFL